MRNIPFGFMNGVISTQIPTPTPLPPAEVRYTYVAISGARLKQMRDYNFYYTNDNTTFSEGAFLIGGCGIPALPVLCYSGNKTSWSQTALNNSVVGIPNSIFITRNVRMDSGTGSGQLNSHKVELFINNVLLTSQTNSTIQSIPMNPSSISNDFTFTGITINAGDYFEIRWTDTIPS
jgi:hypothetical protein